MVFRLLGIRSNVTAPKFQRLVIVATPPYYNYTTYIQTAKIMSNMIGTKHSVSELNNNEGK